MMFLKKHAVLVALAVAAGLSAFCPGRAHAAEWIVDDDGEQCPTRNFATIQAAVNFAAPGDRVSVCPGFYPESVVINKRLSVIGTLAVQYGGKARKIPPFQAVDLRRNAFVFPAGGGNGFFINADLVTLSRFVIQASVFRAGIGIFVHPNSTRTLITNNAVRQFGIGIYLNGGPAIVDDNFLSNGFDGVFSDQGLVDSDVTRNLFTATTGGAGSIVFAAGTGLAFPFFQDNLFVDNNDMVNDGSIEVFNTTNTTISNNRRVDRTVYPNTPLPPLPGGVPPQATGGSDGIALNGGNFNIFLDNNTVVNTRFDGILLWNSAIAGPFGPIGPNVAPILVQRSNLQSNGMHGIQLLGITNALGVSLLNGMDVEQNTIGRSGVDGINVNAAINSIIFRNNSDGNGRDGIRVTGPSAGNVLRLNKMSFLSRNLGLDCRDNTVGGGTAGTANFWIDDQGFSDSPRGICRPNVPGAGRTLF